MYAIMCESIVCALQADRCYKYVSLSLQIISHHASMSAHVLEGAEFSAGVTREQNGFTHELNPQKVVGFGTQVAGDAGE